MRFFFNLHDGVDNIDYEGQDFPGINAARIEALRRFCRLVDSSADSLWQSDNVCVEVVNSDRLVLFQIFAFSTMSAAGRALPD